MVTRINRSGNSRKNADDRGSRSDQKTRGKKVGAADDAPQAAPEPVRERMTKVDTAWLRMDSPSNLMMIVGVWVLKPAIKHADLCRRIEETLLKYPRFGQRVEQETTGACWVTDEQFDIQRLSLIHI